LKHFCKSYEINQITEKENRKENKEKKKEAGETKPAQL
jgi:hypothetical protein